MDRDRLASGEVTETAKSVSKGLELSGSIPI
jgi:hypothetical protein